MSRVERLQRLGADFDACASELEFALVRELHANPLVALATVSVLRRAIALAIQHAVSVDAGIAAQAAARKGDASP